jgi:hypothetical protein
MDGRYLETRRLTGKVADLKWINNKYTSTESLNGLIINTPVQNHRSYHTALLQMCCNKM